MKDSSPKQQIESHGAGIFIREGNVLSRLKEEDFHRAFRETTIVWIGPGDFREEEMDGLFDAARSLFRVACFKFPDVALSDRIVARIHQEFPTAQIEGVRKGRPNKTVENNSVCAQGNPGGPLSS